MGDKAQRRAAREQVAAYHQSSLDALVERVAAAIDDWRAGSRDAYDVDEVVHHYQRAARELWKFCWGTGGGGRVEWIAADLERFGENSHVIDWWERGATQRRQEAGPGPSS